MENSVVKLVDVKEGNLFQYWPVVGGFTELGIKTKAVSVPDICPCVLKVNYQLIAPEAQVCPICKIENFDTGIGRMERNLETLRNVPDGVVFELPIPGGNGIIGLFCATDCYTFTGRVCTQLTWPTALLADSRVNSIGYAGTYQGIVPLGEKQ